MRQKSVHAESPSERLVKNIRRITRKRHFVSSLARPGGNITGLANFGPEMSVKWLELVKDLIPNVYRIAVLYDPAVRFLVSGMERAATTTGVQLASFELKNDNALEIALSSFRQEHAEAVIVTLPPRTADQQTRVLQFAATNRLPTVYWWREYVDAGGLIYYGPSVIDIYQRAAVYVHKILKGAKPADLPMRRISDSDCLRFGAARLGYRRMLGAELSSALPI